MPTAEIPVETWVAKMLAQNGRPYLYGAKGPVRFDCSGLLTWTAAQVGVAPRVPDGTEAQWQHIRAHGVVLPINEAIHVRGAVGFRFDPYGYTEHCAAFLGNGNTIEARGKAYGVGMWPAFSRFDVAGLFPGITYSPDAVQEDEDMTTAPTDVVGTYDVPGGTPSVDRWVLHRDGGVTTEGSAPFYGSYFNLPEEDRQDTAPFVAIGRHVATRVVDGKPVRVEGYAITNRSSTNHTAHTYRFPT